MGNGRVVATSVIWIVAGAVFLMGIARGTFFGLYGLIAGLGETVAIFIGAALATRWIWRADKEAKSHAHVDA